MEISNVNIASLCAAIIAIIITNYLYSDLDLLRRLIVEFLAAFTVSVIVDSCVKITIHNISET